MWHLKLRTNGQVKTIKVKDIKDAQALLDDKRRQGSEGYIYSGVRGCKRRRQ